MVKDIHLTERVIDKLRSAATELEEFRLQSTLGKYEARDAYENSRKKIGKLIGQARVRLRSAKTLAKVKKTKILNILEMLEIQLHLGKAETKEAFNKQYQKIRASLQVLEELIQKDHRLDAFYIKLLMEIKKFRIRLEILKLQYSLNKIAVKEEYELRKKDFSKKLKSIRKTLQI